MLYQIILSPRAKADIEQSYVWYEDQQSGLGERFVEATTDRLLKIQQNPELFSLRHKLHREVKVAIFPYVIIYRVNKQRKLITVLSVFHTSLDPRKKMR